MISNAKRKYREDGSRDRHSVVNVKALPQNSGDELEKTKLG